MSQEPRDDTPPIEAGFELKDLAPWLGIDYMHGIWLPILPQSDRTRAELSDLRDQAENSSERIKGRAVGWWCQIAIIDDALMHPGQPASPQRALERLVSVYGRQTHEALATERESMERKDLRALAALLFQAIAAAWQTVRELVELTNTKHVPWIEPPNSPSHEPEYLRPPRRRYR